MFLTCTSTFRVTVVRNFEVILCMLWDLFCKHHVIFYYFSVSSQLRATQGSRHHLIIWLAAAFATTKSFFFAFPTVRYYNKTSFKFSKLGTSFLSWPHTMKLCETFRKQRNIIRPLALPLVSVLAICLCCTSLSRSLQLFLQYLYLPTHPRHII